MHEFEEDPSVQERVNDRLADTEVTLAVAESITGGLVGALVTDVPGSSEYFDRGLVTYTDRAKREELGVQEAVLEDLGAVSGVVAKQMARGVRNLADTTYGVATTGIAGPPPDEVHDDPVGTVYIGVVAKGIDDTAESTSVGEYHFDGTRGQIKERAARQALTDLLALAASDA